MDCDSPLCKAVKDNDLNAVRDILDPGADVDTCQNNGDPPLYVAAQNQHLNIVRELLKYGAAVNKCREDGDTPLFVAVQNGNLDIVRELIKHKADVKACRKDGDPPLVQATINEFSNIVCELLIHGADVNACWREGDPPLVLAVQKGNVEIVRELLKYKPRINACKKDGDPPLVIATEIESLEMVQDLLKAEAEINLCRKDGDPPLVLATQKENVEIVRALLKYNPSVNLCRKDGDPPLVIAAEKGNLTIVSDLLQSNAEVDTCRKGGDPPLVVALQNKHFDMVHTLLEYKPDVNLCRKGGNTALLIAAQHGNLDIVCKLIEHGAEIRKANKDGVTPLFIASKNGHDDIVSTLIKCDADSKEGPKDGDTSLIAAAENGFFGVVCNLINHGVEIDARRSDGATALLLAAQNGHLKIVTKLIEKEADIKTENENGDSPLILAAKNGHLEVVCTLIDNVADIMKENKNGDTPINLAAENGHVEVLCKLIEQNADIKKENKNGDTPLILAAKNGHLKVVCTLIDNGADIMKVNKNGDTPINLAAENGHLEVVCKLIKHDADINKENKDGITPLIMASGNGHVDVVRKLINYEADVNGVGNGITPLIVAAQNGHSECVFLLIESGSDVNPECIYTAIIQNHFSIAQKLLKYISAFRLNEKTKLLKWMTMNNQEQMINMFTANNSVLFEEYDEFQKLTILEIACYQWADVVEWDTIKLLLDNGANPKRTFPLWQNKSAIHFATMGQNTKILEGLATEKDVDVNAIAQGQNALLILIINGNPSKNFEECVDILCNKQIDIKWSKYQNKSAIILAAERNYINIVNLLLSKIDYVSSKEDTVLKSLNGELEHYTVRDSESEVNGLDFLKQGSEKDFILWMETTGVDRDNNQNDSSFLQTACEHNIIKVVEYLIKKNSNNVGKTNKIHPLIIAVRNGYFLLVERILGADNLKIPPNLLSEALKKVHIQSNKDDVNYQSCCEQIIRKKQLDVNDCSNDEEYPLHLAVKYAGADIVSQLLQRKASLANRDKSNNLTIKGIDHDTLKKHFDSCITYCSENNNTNIRTILTFDYTTLLPTLRSPATRPNEEDRVVAQKETDAILEMTQDDNQRPLLQHPLIRIFLDRKWQYVRFLFLSNFLAYFIFCILLWWFICSNYNEVNHLHKDAIYVLLFITTVIILLREIFQAIFMFWTYWKNIDNYFEVALLADVFGLLIFPTTVHNRQPMFAIAALLSALELLFLVGRAPGMSTYIIMLRTVTYNFVKFLLFSAILIIAFAFSFYTLFRKLPGEDATILPKNKTENQDVEINSDNSNQFFNSFEFALFKTMIMLTGEFDVSNLNLKQFSIVSHLILLCFVFLIAIILLNLLNGLAVSDTQKIKNDAKLIAIVSQAQYLARVESILFNGYTPKTWFVWLFVSLQNKISINRKLNGEPLQVLTKEPQITKCLTKIPFSIPKVFKYLFGNATSETTIDMAKSITLERETFAKQVDPNYKELVNLKKIMIELKMEIINIKTTVTSINNKINSNRTAV